MIFLELSKDLVLQSRIVSKLGDKKEDYMNAKLGENMPSEFIYQ